MPVATDHAEERKDLHALINDPKLKDAQDMRHDRVAAYLYDVHMRQCQNSADSHPGQICHGESDAAVDMGKEVADQQCNFCHLFGLGKAPAFRKLARQELWTGRSLAEMQRRGHENARRYGHQMSPVGLTREQFEALAIYVNSLK
ncbi:MAG TPA: c-type cytochrome [Stellaceae bacterium]|nr:c-type cytochrome [Stellaceae bacterium]